MTSKTAHTPGPWAWDAGIIPPDGPERYADIYDDDETIIASFNDQIPEGRANARLIAAAPDLLKALKEVAREREYTSYISELVDDVIAKATPTGA